LKTFTHCWPEKADGAKTLLEKEFVKRVEVLKQRKEDNIQVVEKETPAVDEEIFFEMFSAPAKSTEENKELEVYLNNMDCLERPPADCPKSVLLWWKGGRYEFLFVY
jgi:hypothetical protein